MADLNDFVDSPQFSLEDFAPDKVAAASAVNDITVKNAAAHAVALAGPTVANLQTYDTITSEMRVGGSSPMFDQVVGDAAQQDQAQDRRVLPSVLLDPSVPDETKKSAAQNVLSVNNPAYSPQNTVSRQALTTPQADETPEQGLTRISIAATFQRMNDIKRAKQALLNNFIVRHDPTLTSKVGGVLGGLIPLTTGAAQERILNKFVPNTSLWDKIDAVIQPGDAKQKIIDHLEGLPPEQQVAALQNLLDITSQTSGIVAGTSNDFNTLSSVNNYVNSDQYYADSGKFWDNVFGALDLVVLGGVAGKGARVIRGVSLAAQGDRIAGLAGKASRAAGEAKGALVVVDAADNVGRDAVKGTAQPMSVSQNLKDTNPKQFRLTYQAAQEDPTDETANATHGTSRNDAVVSDAAPEVAHSDGSVNAKVSQPDFKPQNKLDPDVEDFVNNDGLTALDKSEKARTRARIVHDFGNAHTLNERTEMFQLLSLESKDFPEGGQIDAIYGMPESGYFDPDHATALIQWALREFGVTGDEAMLFKRAGDTYYPYKPEPRAAEGPQNNASGQTDVSLEATNRQESERASGQLRFRVDKSDNITPEIGIDAIDRSVPKGEMIVKSDGKGGWIPETTGIDIRPADAQSRVARLSSKLDMALRDSGAPKRSPLDPGDYLIEVHHKYRFSPGDIDPADWFETTTKRDFFDMVPPVFSGEHGTITQHLFPAGSVQDPLVSLSAATTSEKTAGLEAKLLQPMQTFTKLAKGLSKERHAKLISKINDMNLREYEPTLSDLRGEGFQPDEISALTAWRKLWDNVWWLENEDKAKTLIARGYKTLVDPASNTNLHAKPIAHAGNVPKNVEVVDIDSGGMRVLSPKDVEEIYSKKGVVAKLVDPIKVGDDFAEYVISPENPDRYLRKITPNDTVLNYRRGHYHVSYKGPYFIDRVWPGKGGKPDTIKTVNTASNKKDADLLAARLNGTVDDSTHIVRLDRNMNASTRSKTTWDLQNASGRSAQRFRGQRLEDATSNAMDPTQSNILNPIESAVRAVRSIATRASVRDWLDMTKSRFLVNRADYLPNGEFGQKVFPADRRDIKIQSGKAGSLKGVASARAEFDYIRAMEHGYINSIDNIWKNSLNTIAEILGEKHLKVAEKGARAVAKVTPTAQARKLSFGLFLALNPLRQIIVQGQQALLMANTNPGWFLTRAVPQTTYLMARLLGMKHESVPKDFFTALMMSPEEADAMYNHFQRSGLVAAVDKHSIVRGSLTDMADRMISNSFQSAVSKTIRPLKVLGNWSRKIGFDSGETFQIAFAWAGFYDKAKKAGVDVSKSDEQAHIAALARNYTGSMNAAGDMPYNTNELNMLLQFQQQGHKMAMLMTTNRVLSRAERLRLIGFSTIMYGIPVGLGALLYSAITSDSDSDHTAAQKAHIVELLDRGAASAVLNRTASTVSGDKVDIDFSSLSPLNMYGTSQLIHSLFTESPGQVLANTPSGSLLFGGNPRLTNFVKTTAQFFHLINDNGNPVTFSQEAKAFTQLSSGASNMFKAAYALKYKKTISMYSNHVTDNNVSTPEAIAIALGFPTWDAVEKANANEQMYEQSVQLETDINNWYKNFKSDMMREGMTAQETQFIVRAHNQAFQVWGDNPRVSKIIEANLLKDASNGDLTFYKRALNNLGIMSYTDWRKMVLDDRQIDDKTKQQMLEIGKLYNPSNAPKDEK